MAPPRKIPIASSESEFCLKKPDGEPLLRHDIQYDLLQYIFSDRVVDFTAPVDQNAPLSPPVKLHFDQLYLEAILSSKLPVGLRNNLISNPEFALNFSCLALLVNCGRLNTTLSFQVETRTAARTYHSIPSLQRDESSKRFQDTTRIKANLRTSHLDSEGGVQSGTLAAIARKSADPQLHGPPTTVITAIFNLFGLEAQWVSSKYFPTEFTIYDLFYPSSLSVESRGQAFLTLVHHILENKTFINDFTSDFPYSPRFIHLVPNDECPTDDDTREELEFAAEMQRIRAGVVAVQPLQASPKKAMLNATRGLGVGSDAESIATVARTKGRRNGIVMESYARSRAVKSLGLRQLEREKEDFSRTVIATTSTLPYMWDNIKRDTRIFRDPDYDSEEEEWPLDLLLQRSLLTVSDDAGFRGGQSA